VQEVVEKKEDEIVELTPIILTYVESQTAGSPTDEKVKWTHLRPFDIATYLKNECQLNVSHGCIKRILKADGYVRRKPIKCLATGSSKHRAEQFRIINFLVAVFTDMPHNPIISIDTKKKEPLGRLTRNEQVLTKKDEIPEVFSSDYSFLATGRVIPHGIFDVKLNKGYISLGTSYETADFVIDNLRWWWLNFGELNYPDASHILIFSDCGGANSYRHHRYKMLLQKLAKELGIRIVMAHYPPYCSKYNPIERKLFSHVHRTIKNTILINLKQVKELIMKTSTSKGLTVEVRIVDKLYPLKQPSNKEDIDEKRIFRHPVLPQFSYTITP